MLIIEWLLSSDRLLDIASSSDGCYLLCVYWAPMTPPVVAVLGSYIQWRNVALSLDPDRTQYFSIYGCSPPPAPTPYRVTLHSGLTPPTRTLQRVHGSLCLFTYDTPSYRFLPFQSYQMTTSVVLATDPEVPGSIPGATRCSGFGTGSAQLRERIRLGDPLR
jgi:hypothetical protein